ncbi:Rab3 GTPase-activating protein catalytic subunit [Actinomortierella wolfii]|nr:Rab3 GTPase-activating protein catalytic subunit [Actinomortierella wolfii]
METDEQFEFIDFSAASGWEKFIKSIEDVLLGWDLGGESPASPPSASPSSLSRAFTANPTDKNLEDDGEGNAQEQQNQQPCAGGTVKDASCSFQLKEVITLEDASYTLSYHYHPAKERMATLGASKIDLDFLPVTLEGVSYHALHRWTGLTQLLIVSPVTISDIFASTVSPASSVVVDLSTAKLLLSSFAIAFQNTGCRIPVFVSTGQPWNNTFAGLSVQPQSASGGSSARVTTHLLQPSVPPTVSTPRRDDLEDLEEDQAIEVRFNTILVPYPPVQYSYLSGLLGFFIERMGIEDNGDVELEHHHSDADLSKYSFHLKESIHVSALFCYDIVNWYDEDWRRWPESPSASTTNRDGQSGVHGDAGMRNQDESSSNYNRNLYDEDRISRQRMDELQQDQSSSLSMDRLKVEGKATLRLLPTLPFGPVRDPVKSLRLQARFASAPSTMYLDSRSFTDMDPSQANIWIISVAFKEDDYGMLSGILDDALASWTSEIMSSVPSSKMGSEGKGERQQQQQQHTYESLLHTGARIIQGTITMVDASDVENIVQALFEADSVSPQEQGKTSRGGSVGGRRRERITSAALRSSTNRARLISAAELGMHFRHGTTVPVDSFLWRMLQYLVDVISPNSDISYPTSIMGFLKVLWSEILKQFYLHWENSELVPLVDMYQHDDFLDDIDEEDEEEESRLDEESDQCVEQQETEKNATDNQASKVKNDTDADRTQMTKKTAKKKKAKRVMSIDMRYNLLHQKISMLNCCIARQQEINRETPANVIPLHRRSHLASPLPKEETTMGSPSLAATGSDSGANGGRGTGQFHSLLQGLSEMSRPRSADVVPMAKRLIETAKSKGSEVLSSYAGGGDKAGSRSANVSRVSSPPPAGTAATLIPVRRSSSARGRRGSRRAEDGSTLVETDEDEGDDEQVYYDTVEGGGDIFSVSSASTSSSRQQRQQQAEQQQEHQRADSHSQHDPRSALHRHHGSQSMADSYVQLKYSSSVESQSAVLVPSSAVLPSGSGDASGDNEQGGDTGSSGASSSVPGESIVLDPREVQDPEASEGALEPFKDLKLLETGAQMMVPKLQEYGFMTEDMIQQQEELFETLGSSLDGAKTRAKMQSSQLVSDMEAFKAANPGCVLGDFIRWHSPKDWDEVENKMSPRMADSGNYWQELWTSAKRIPASRQTPLFNHNQEAAKALLLPSICLIAYDTLVSHPVASHIRQVAEHLRDLAQDLTEFGWNELAATSEDKHLDELIERFRQVELLMGRAIALVRKFPGQYSLVERLLDETESVVEDGPERENVYELFSMGGSLSSSFPQPTLREFVLETFDPYSSKATSPEVTGWHSRPLQRRLYACFKDTEVRLVEAVAKDGMFM